MAVVNVNTAFFSPRISDGQIVYGSASGVGTATVGDYVAASGYWFFAANTGFIGSPAFKASGVGIAMDNNPIYDELGVARANSALPVATVGIFRVTGMSGASGEFPVWTPVVPLLTGSGIVGQTGLTGIGSRWGTAPMQGISANPTGALASGVGRLLKVISDGATGQWDIFVSPPRADYF